MAEIGRNTFGSSPFVPPTPSAPPPPPEVKVRTMRSDLEAMAKSGGGIPRFENVRVYGLSIGKQSPVGTAGAIGSVAGPGAGATADKKNTAVIVLVVIAALAILGILGYLAYRFFS